MPSSTVRREKLIGLRHLILIGFLFAVSFLVFKPKQQALSLDSLGGGSSGPVDDLDLAYIKARAANGRQTPEEVFVASRSLIKSGQLQQAKELLETYPNLTLNESQRYFLDLEIDAVDFAAATLDERENAVGLQLFNTLHVLLDKPELHTVDVLSRATSLATQLDRLDLSAALYQLLAATDSQAGTKWFEECADFFSGHSEHEYALQCLEEGLLSASNEELKVGLQSQMLRQHAMLGNEMEVESLIDLLSMVNQKAPLQTESVAKIFLEIGRPDKAYLLFGSLAEAESEHQDKWLLLAVRWSEAAARPDEAIDFINILQTRKFTGPTLDGKTLDEKLDSLLLAAGRNGEVFQRLNAKIESHPDDEDYLETGVQWAQQLGRYDQASIWNEHLLTLAPENKVAVNRQIEISIAAKNLPAAKLWVERLLALQPENIDTRKRLARITEWNGDPVGAQGQWQLLVKQSAEPEYLLELIRLSEMNFEPALTADSLKRLSERQKLKPEQRSAMVKAYELDGRPADAAKAMQEMMKRYGQSAELLQELALLHYRHHDYPSALATWNRLTTQYGATVQANLYAVELQWRMGSAQRAAELSDSLNGETFVSIASEYQLGVLSEISWRYRKPLLAADLKSVLGEKGEASRVAQQRNRIVEDLAQSGEPELAAAKAATFYERTGEASLGLKAMDLALQSAQPTIASELLSSNDANKELRKLPQYWVKAAALHLRNGEKESARDAYQKALTLSPSDLSAISGWLWFLVGENENDEILAALELHADKAQDSSLLWGPYAVAYAQTGYANKSLKWFELLGDSINTDYAMLLSYADALEYSGRAEHAFRIREFTIGLLRPLLAQTIGKEQDVLVRQYAGLLQRYASTETNERWASYLLSTRTNTDDVSELWKEDIAIAWLMSTQRHEHARIIMAATHDLRAEDPLWQKLSMAMADKNHSAVKTILQNNQGISPGNQILARTMLGNNTAAYKLARKTLVGPASLGDRVIAENQYEYLRSTKPSYTGGLVRNSDTGNLATAEKGFVLRHSFSNSDIGLELDYTDRTLSSDYYNVAQSANRIDLALTMFLGDSQFGGSITSGFISADDDDTAYSSARLYRQSRSADSSGYIELAFNETATQSPHLRIAGVQNRLSLGYQSNFGAREYFKLNLNSHDIKSRTQEQRVARGLDSRVELGMRDSMGSNTWSASVAAAHSRYRREENLPQELLLAADSNIESVLSENSSAVYLGASLSRGGVGAEFPQTSSPRYYVNGNLGHSWPAKKLGVQLEAGAGFRILGGDELSFSMSHDALASQLSEGKSNSTSFGLNYRYHFRQ